MKVGEKVCEKVRLMACLNVPMFNCSSQILLSLNIQQATSGESGCHFNSVGGARVQLQAIGASVEKWRGKWVRGNGNTGRGHAIKSWRGA